MTQSEKKQVRILRWRERGWTWDRIARKVGLKDRRFAQIAAKRAVAKGLLAHVE